MLLANDPEFWEGIEGSWGLAIILLTFTIRLLILPLTFKSVKSMQKLQVLQPEIKKIQERYKEDRQRMNQEMMAFYSENKVNPLGSCLPILLQIPFFIALFDLLRSDSFEEDIAGEESFFFLSDLAEPPHRHRRVPRAGLPGRPVRGHPADREHDHDGRGRQDPAADHVRAAVRLRRLHHQLRGRA